MDLLEVFEGSDDLIDLPAGEVLFQEGEGAEFMYVVMKGEISLSLHGAKLATVSEGAVLGEMALVSADQRSATATAVEDSRLAPIDVHSFKLLIQHTPDFALHIMKVLAGRLRRANEALSGHFPV